MVRWRVHSSLLVGGTFFISVWAGAVLALSVFKLLSPFLGQSFALIGEEVDFEEHLQGLVQDFVFCSLNPAQLRLNAFLLIRVKLLLKLGHRQWHHVGPKKAGRLLDIAKT